MGTLLTPIGLNFDQRPKSTYLTQLATSNHCIPNSSPHLKKHNFVSHCKDFSSHYILLKMSRRAPDPAAERTARNAQTIKSLLKLEGNKSCADCKRNKRTLLGNKHFPGSFEGFPCVPMLVLISPLQIQDGRVGI